MIHQIQEHDETTADFCIKILSALTLTFRPLRLQEVVSAASLPEMEFEEVENLIVLLEHCGSFLTWRDNTISFVHQSAKDYLVSPERLNIFPSAETGHRNLALRFLRAQHVLKKDFCGIGDYGPLSADAKARPHLDALGPIAYALYFWIDHVCALNSISEGEALLANDGEIPQFFQKHFLHWLECLSLLGKISDAVGMIRKLHKLTIV